MAIELVCGCGGLVIVDRPPGGQPPRCPRCGGPLSPRPEPYPSAVTSPADQQPLPVEPAASAALSPKPLWAVMGRPPAGNVPAVVDHPAVNKPVMEVPESPAAPVESAALPSSGGQGLWRVMKGTGDIASADAAPVAAGPTPLRKSLWNVVRDNPSATAESVTPGMAPPQLPVQAEFDQIHAPDPDQSPAPLSGQESTARESGMELVFALTPDQTSIHNVRGAIRQPRSALGVVASVLGGLAVPLAFVALVDSPWSRIPATVAGFSALVLGLVAVSEIKRSRGRQTGMGLAVGGIVAGIVGMFLGPVILAGFGRQLLQQTSRSYSDGHLRTVGEALAKYHDDHGAFPPGGVFKPGKDGRERGYHGWMTMLLPYVAEETLYKSIRLDRPYDAQVNFPALSRDVEIFFAAGADRGKVHGGLGVAHFAGVGGEVEDSSGGYVQAGLFGVNSSVSRDHVTDGLANTLAAGEIADNFPAWGDPENWRTIGRGLNRDPQGFGNHSRTGASFLMADGSVRYFSSKTDVRILIRLSTLDGGEEK